MKLDRKKLLATALLGLSAACVAQAPGPGHTVDMQRSLAAVREGVDLHAVRRVSVRVSSRRTDDPPLPVRAEKLQAQLIKALRKSPYSVVSDPMSAQSNVELVIEPHQPLGAASKDTARYMFLLLREHATARVQYCGYQRVSHFYEKALDRLAQDLLRNTGAGPAATGDLEACAKAAMRLADVGL